MRPLGIFTNVISARDHHERADRIVELGFNCVQLEPLTPRDAITPQTMAAEAAPYHAAGLTVAAVAGYTNLVNPDATICERHLAELERVLAATPAAGCTDCCTETGTRNPSDQWLSHPSNTDQATWNLMLAAIDRLLPIAEAAGSRLAIEGYVENVVRTRSDVMRLLAQRSSPALAVVLDPNNLYEQEMLTQQADELPAIVASLAPHAAIAHAKDVVYHYGSIDTPRAGTGVLDWPLFTRLLDQHCPDLPLILEHLSEDQIPQVLGFVREQCEAAVAIPT
jgi:sugar phosphate isomerase/epimerase